MLLEKLSSYTILLGSQSPRRKFLLEHLGIPFSVLPPLHANEHYPSTLKDAEIAMYLAKEKSLQYASYLQDNHTIIITADTIVSLDNKVLGKPQTYNEAYEMLQQLSGKKHIVFTGVCLKMLEKEIIFFDTTEVYFKILSEKEIDFYIHNYKPFDKAGSYGAQEWIGLVAIERINGSYFNVMGLPVHKLYQELENLIL
ncbi:MAG: Maf family nucleotide pyrophosphatase [Bacteroidales bacterium]|nr:Maf family nucleotide pyrophosphatase [Bacteroidales bacterium]